MTKIRTTLLFAMMFLIAVAVQAQESEKRERINPVIKGYGGIFDAPHAVEKPDPNMEYKVVIDVVTTGDDKSKIPYSLINVARLMNLHAMGGLPHEKMNIVLAVHGGAAYYLMDNESYKERFETDNPSLGLLKELTEAGVKIYACSQSLMGRGIDHEKLAPGAKVATSMLTVMTTHQMKGYAALKF